MVVMSMGLVDSIVEREAGDGIALRIDRPWWSGSAVTPCAMMPFVLPLARAILIDFGGQVEKYPADEDDCAMVAVMTVVPGCSAVMTLVVGLIVATEVLPDRKLSVPMELEHSGSVAEPGRAKECGRAIRAVVGLGVELSLLVLRIATLRRRSPGAEW